MIEDYYCYGCGSINLRFDRGFRVVCLDCGRDWYEIRKSIQDKILFEEEQ